MKLEDKLLSLRKQQGLTQLELAEALHISRQAISKWETGEAEPSLENLKSLSQIYHISLDELLGEGKLPEPKAPPEDQPPVQPPQEEPKEKTDGEPPAAVSAGEEAPPQKPPRRKKVVTALLLGWAAVLSIGIAAGYLWWNSQPAQQFSYWHKTPSERPTQGGLCFVVDTITVNADGSGNISYILYNNGSEVDYWGAGRSGGIGDCWVDYCYEDNWYQVSPSPTSIPLGVFSLNSVEPSQLESSTDSLPAGTLAMPGRYRFCVENVGYVEFALFENGRFYDVLIGKGQQFW